MTIQCEVRIRRTKTPDLYSPIKRSTGKSICVLWVKCDLHDIVRVTLKDLGTHPALVPIPKLYQHVI
uniref:Uncharacterized protein n=1 Tax=Arundo donax TaxID=35708 RepID=A0A0A9E295_ARUDO